MGIVYLVCKKQSTSLTNKEIAQRLGWKERDMNKGYRYVNGILKVRNDDKQIITKLRKYCTDIGIGELSTKCHEITDYISNMLEGRRQETIAAVIIMFVCEHEKILNSEIEDKIVKECKISLPNLKQVYETYCTEQEKGKIFLKLDQLEGNC